MAIALTVGWPRLGTVFAAEGNVVLRSLPVSADIIPTPPGVRALVTGIIISLPLYVFHCRFVVQFIVEIVVIPRYRTLFFLGFENIDILFSFTIFRLGLLKYL
jgi:hypothetical protein